MRLAMIIRNMRDRRSWYHATGRRCQVADIQRLEIMSTMHRMATGNVTATSAVTDNANLITWRFSRSVSQRVLNGAPRPIHCAVFDTRSPSVRPRVIKRGEMVSLLRCRGATAMPRSALK